jgi:hypothetical protein
VDGKAEGRLDQLRLRERGPHREHDPRDLTRQLTRQLDPAAVQEQIHDRQLATESLEQLQGLGAVPDDVDDIAAPPQDGGEGPARLDVWIHEQHGA